MKQADIFVVLRTGGEFGLQHVFRLYNQLVQSGAIGKISGRKMVLLTDMHSKLVPKFPWTECISNPKLGPRWWGKIESMQNCGPDGMWLVDLDTTIFRFPEDQEKSTFNADFYNSGRYGSGFCYLTQDDAWKVYDQYLIQGPEEVQQAFSGKDPATLGDQAFIASVLGSREIFDEGVVCSYKKHVRPTNKVPQTADVVCFHGRPRPWSIPELRDPQNQKRVGP